MRGAEALRNQCFERLPHDFGVGVSEDLLGTLIEKDDTALLVDRDDGVRGDREDTRKARLGAALEMLSFPAARIIPHDADEADRFAQAEFRRAARYDMAGASARRDDPEFREVSAVASRVDRPLEGFQPRGPVLRMDHLLDGLQCRLCARWQAPQGGREIVDLERVCLRFPRPGSKLRGIQSKLCTGSDLEKTDSNETAIDEPGADQLVDVADEVEEPIDVRVDRQEHLRHCRQDRRAHQCYGIEATGV